MPPSPKPPTGQDLYNRCVAELTACQVDLMAELGVMKQAIIDAWEELSPSERNPTKKKEMCLAGLDDCYVLEDITDDTVREILDRYEKELKAIGADTTVLSTLWDYYEDEKASQKAYYLNKYLYE